MLNVKFVDGTPVDLNYQNRVQAMINEVLEEIDLYGEDALEQGCLYNHRRLVDPALDGEPIVTANRAQLSDWMLDLLETLKSSLSEDQQYLKANEWFLDNQGRPGVILSVPYVQRAGKTEMDVRLVSLDGFVFDTTIEKSTIQTRLAPWYLI